MPKSASARNKESIKIDKSFTESIRDAILPIELPDIVTFAESEHFCNKKLYPRQRTLLRLMFLETDHMTDYDKEVIEEWRNNFFVGEDRIGVPPDIWKRIEWCKENGYSHFREIEFIGGRRGGKGHLGGIIGAYQAYKMISLDSPQWYYGVDPNKDLYLFVTATNLSQARDYQYKDIAETISNAPCFEKYISTNKGLSLTLRTPADIRKIADMERRNVPMDREIASIRIVALSSNSRAGRGAATFALFFDEMAHMMSQTEGPNTAEEVYKALTPSLDQMGKEGLIYIPTSPYSKVGQAYNIYQQGISSNERGEPLVPNLLVVQMPSWEPYKDWDNPKIVQVGTYRGAPQTYDEEVRKLEERDPDSFKVERRAQWSEVINSYLNPQVVDKMFDPIKYPDGEVRELQNQQPGVARWIYRGHADPGVSQANFAVAIGHTEPFWDEETKETMFHVVFDYLQVWRPQDFPDHQVDYLAIEEQLVNIISKYPTLKTFSFDQYGGFVTVPYLKSHLRKRGHQARVRQATFTPKSNQIRAERFKSALGMGWVHAPRDAFAPDNLSLLELELKFLQLKNGKVVKQDVGPVTTKDLADAVMEVTSELLADQIDRRHNRSALAGGRLSLGAAGGYHSQMDLSSARGKLTAHGTLKSTKDIYGQRFRGR